MFSLVLCFSLLGFVASSPTKSLQDLKIVGGEDVDISEVPYQVSLLRNGRHSCGGSIIAKDLIMTAAHCVMGAQARSFQIRAGSSYNQKGGKVYPVGEILWHPEFSYSNMDHDVALMWLSKPIEFNENAAPVELADEDDIILDGEPTLVTGWGNLMEGGGYPTKLQKVVVPKINEEVCDEAYKPLYSITPLMLCAGVEEGGKDACQGDSGGPLVHNSKLAGVVSWGLGCARPDYPGVYARVSALRPWIDESIAFLRMKHMNLWRA